MEIELGIGSFKRIHILVSRCRNIVNKVWATPPCDILKKIRKRMSFTDEVSDRETGFYIWSLSTGRVGTQTLAALGELATAVHSIHEPAPLLYGLSRESYLADESSMAAQILCETLRTTRDIKLYDNEKAYFESSPQVTFLARHLLKVFPKSVFFHVLRHPASVIRSGMRRNWYGGHANDCYRITPKDGVYKERWREMSQLQKNIWLWAETNRWISSFVKNLESDRVVVLRSEDLFGADEKTLDAFYRHLGAEKPSKKKLEKVLGRKLNSQQKGDFPSLKDWSVEDRADLKEIAGDVMDQYSYFIESEE